MTFYDTHKRPHELPEGEQIHWRVSAYGLIVNKNNEMLMVTPTWRSELDLPGGGVDLTESIEQGLKRECLEETGYKVKLSDPKPFHISETNFFWLKDNTFCHSVNFFYEAELESEKQDLSVINVAEPNEIAKVEWISLDNLTEQNCFFMYMPIIDMIKLKYEK